MEVWALYAYGASNVLQEILTIKSDDTDVYKRQFLTRMAFYAMHLTVGLGM